MTVLLLMIIYLAFISLGLPDSLLGVAWPAIRSDWNLPLDAAGIVSFVAIGFTVLSSLLNGKVIRKVGTGRLTFISCVMTAGALLAISVSPSFIFMVLLAIPLGLGGGSVDAGLNSYVASHFKSHHMNWLHSFWGVGATLGPVIMGSYLLNATWREGYQSIAIIQFVLAAILLLSLPLWKMHKGTVNKEADPEHMEPDKDVLKKKGLFFSIATFLFYVAVEMSVGLWGASYLVQIKGLEVNEAARWIALYFGGITVGRMLAGFISFKLNNRQMIRSGVLLSFIGAVLLLLPVPTPVLMAAFVLMGLGFAPIFPGMIHETPTRFGKNNSGTIIGFQMAASYSGSAVIPPLFGVFGRAFGMQIFPPYAVIMIILVFICSETVTLKTRKTA